MTESNYSIQSVNGTITIGPSVTALGVRNGVVDCGDWTASLTGGGSAIYAVDNAFGVVELAQSDYTFSDTFSSGESELYSSNGAPFGAWIGGTADLFSNGAFNYVDYCFARQLGDPTLLTADVSATLKC